MSFFPDGRELDDMKPQDVASAIGGVFEILATHFENGGQYAHANEMSRAAELMRQWARFGLWFTKGDLRNVARRAIWLNATEADRMQNLVTYEDADRAVKEHLEQ